MANEPFVTATELSPAAALGASAAPAGAAASATPSWISGLSTPSIESDMAAADVNGVVTAQGLTKLLTDLDATLSSSTLTSAEFSDLQTIAANLNNGLSTSSYLTYVFKALVNGNAANADWTGGGANSVALGNLAAGASQTQLGELIDKWFLGTDLPSSYVDMSGSTPFTVTYSTVTNALFGASGPSMNDIKQGYLGDCYFEASCAEVADMNPSDIESMFTNNGNGTYGVRFYYDGAPEYVTVNLSLADGGTEFNQATDIWASLAEKAWAQFQAINLDTGNSSYNYGNSWSTIGNGGYIANALEALTGASVITGFDPDGTGWDDYTWNSSLTTTGYTPALTTQSVLASVEAALASHDDVDISSNTNAYDASGNETLISDHVFSVYGYNSTTGMLELRNPWGTASGQNWDTTFEVPLATLLADGDWVEFDNAGTTTSATPNFTLWSSPSDFFFTSAGPVNGEDWAISNSADGNNPIWVDTYTPAATYVAGQSAQYTIALTSQDWVGAQQPQITVATTTLVDPFVSSSATSFGNLAGDATFTSNSSTGSGAVVYWKASATSGDYDVEFQPYTTTYVAAPSTGPNTTLTGSAVTLEKAIANPTSWDFNYGSAGLVFSYTTKASATTENIYFQAFNTSGVATSPLEEVANGVAAGTPYYVGYNSSTGAFTYAYAVVNGSSTGFYYESFNTTTGALGSPIEYISAPSFTSIFGISDQSDVGFIEGMSGGQHVLDAFLSGSSTPIATFDLTGSTADHWSTASVYDPSDGKNDNTVLAYSDNNQVHLELLDASGEQIGSDFVVPGLTSFDRIHTLGSRVEIDYTVADPNGGTEVEAYIYDTATGPENYTLSGGGEYVGTPFNDTITDAAGTYFVDGGGGVDTFVVPDSANQVVILADSKGDPIVETYSSTTLNSSTLTGTATLEGFTYVQMNGATLTYSSTSSGEVATISAGGLAQFHGATPWTIAFASGGGEVASLFSTGGSWDSVTGSNGTVNLNSAQASVTGGGDGVVFAGGTGDAASLVDTGGSWDWVSGADGTVYLTSAQVAVYGGGDGIEFAGGTGDAASLVDTGGDWDWVSGSNGAVYLASAQATVTGTGDTVGLSGSSSVTMSGGSNAFDFGTAFGKDVIGGFASTDSIQFSATDFASWSALQSHMSQSGANTVITLDANDTVTLTNVTKTSLTASQFKFV